MAEVLTEMAHHCHATGCNRSVPPEMLMCRVHWFKVPKPIRCRVWEHYRVGQCDDWRPSAAYCRAARDAVIAVAEKEGVEPDVELYDVFLAAAEEREREVSNDAQA